MTKRPRNRTERAIASAALAGRKKGVPLGGRARKLAERCSSEELEELSSSEAAKKADQDRKRGGGD